MLVPYSKASLTWNVACTQYRQLHGLCQRTAYAYSLSGNALAEDSRVFVDEQVLDRRLVVLAGRGTREGPTASCRHDLDWCLRWCKGGAGDAPAETSDCPARANMRAGEMGGGGKDGQAGSSWCVELVSASVRALVPAPGRALFLINNTDAPRRASTITGAHSLL